MATDDVVDVVLSAAVFFEIFGIEVTDSDEDAKELCDTVIIRRRHQRPRRYWVHPVNCRRKLLSTNNAYGTQCFLYRPSRRILRYSSAALLNVRLNACSTISSSLTL